MAERYLQKYAAGKEEHALVKLQPSQSFNQIEAVDEGIINMKVTGVELQCKEIPGVSCYRIAQTECAFFCWSYRTLLLILISPGSGKTFLATLGVAYALSKGLFVYVTSLAGKRAYSFGGEHIHRYFGLPVNNNLTPFQQAEFALRKFNHQIERKSLLMRLQVLLVEEITLINAQQWAAMDLILQQLKHSNVPFGGVFIIATGDRCQLPSVSGTNLFMSPMIMTTFNLQLLQHFVRMRDPVGQAVLRRLWEKPVTPEDVAFIVRAISDNCIFLESWTDLTDPTLMRVFGRRAAAHQAVAEYFERVKNSGDPFVTMEATDEVARRKCTGWTAATS